MIINGGSRSNGGFFARHLMRADENERVSVVEMRDLGFAEDVRDAFAMLKGMADSTNCKNWFYHANLNTRADETLTPEQWTEAVDRLESELQLTGQPRFVVEHDKEGRVHRHVVWGRIDADTMKAIPDGHNYRKHELVATDLETRFGHEATARALTRDKETTPRPEPRAKDWETFRAQKSKICPDAMKAELTELWRHADTGRAFSAALEERGYILARGDRRDFCVVDEAGHEHSLGRRLEGVKAAGVRERMADVERDSLPSVAEARELARAHWEDADSGGGAAPSHEQPLQPEAERETVPLSDFDALMLETRRQAALLHPLAEHDERDASPILPAPTPQAARSAFDEGMAETIRRAARLAAAEAATPEDERRRDSYEGWRANVRRHLGKLRGKLLEWWRDFFAFEEPETPEKGHER